MKITKRRPLADGSSEIVTVQQLAEYLRYHPSTVYRLLRNHEIPGFKLGGSWRFRRADVEKWIARMSLYQKYKLHQ
jgi:excisionase family DNA binding protein